MKPIVSVLMTAYNREKFIAEAIESVLASTYINFELIIVDDCSKDSTVEVASKYASADSRIKLYINKRNLGDYPNRNIAASYAIGKYIMFVDSDDSISRSHLQNVLNICLHDPSISLVLPARIHDDFKGVKINLPLQSYKEHFLSNGFLETGPLGALIKKECFDKIGGFTGRRMIGDVELFLKIARGDIIARIDSTGIQTRIDNEKESKYGEYYYLVEIIEVYKTILFDKKNPLYRLRYYLLLKKFCERGFVIVKRFIVTFEVKYVGYFFKAIYYLFK